MRALVLMIALATCPSLLAQVTMTADSWPGSRPQVYESASGTHRFKTRPPQLSTWSGKSQGTLVRVSADGTETALWSRDLVNIPVIAHVADDGQHVVTFDTWARLGYEHALVIYGEKGAVVADLDLEALLPAEDITTAVVHSANVRRWLQGATIAFDTSGDAIVINLHWGRVIRVALATGTIETAK